MAWVKIDDQLHSHPKVVEAGNEALGLWLRLLTWSAAHLTDGLIPIVIIDMFDRGDGATESLVSSGLLDVVPDGDYQIHDYLEWNPPADEIKEKRRVERERKSRGRKSQVSARTPPGQTADSARNPVVPSPSPSPSHIERDQDSESEFQNLGEIEAVGYSRYGALAGKSVVAIERLGPVRRWEMDRALGTGGNSWIYAARVIESCRQEAERERAPPAADQAKRKSKSGLIQGTRNLMEGWANEANEAEVPGDDVGAPRRLSTSGERGPV